MMLRTLNTERGTISIRPITSTDVERVREMRLDMLLHSPEASGDPYEEDIKEPIEYWHMMIEDRPDRFWFGAEVHGRLVGMAKLALWTGPKMGHRGEIGGVYVDPAWRGLHIARELVQACLDKARDHSLRLVKLDVHTENAAAIRCYAGCGFTVFGIEPEIIFANGCYFDALLMVKRL